MHTLLKDLGYAGRTLRKNPGFATVAVVTIGLGIGACTAIFSVVNAVLLRPLPYAEPQHLALVWSELRARNVPDFPFPIPDLRDLRLDATTFEAFAGVTPPGRVAIGDDRAEPEQIRAGAVTTNLFTLLGARVLIGRDFVDDDGAPQPVAPAAGGVGPGGAGAAGPAGGAAAGPAPPRLPVMAILSYGFWQRRYGGDATVVGRSIEFGNGRAQIVGVLAPGFEVLFPQRAGINPTADMWTAIRLNFDTAARNVGVLRVIGRVKPGVTYEQAQADLEGIAASLRDRFAPKKNANLHIRVVPMHEDLVRDVRPSILALLGAVLFVLLIACANVANLLVVRASARHRELAIRAAIGGSRWRLVRELLIETLILSALGAMVGLLLAQYGIDMLLTIAPPGLPRIESIHLDPIVLAFTAAATLVTAVVCGLVPALRASRPDLVDVLRISGGSPGLRAGRRLRNGVVVAEVALSFVLLVGSGLMLRSFLALQHVDVGYDPTNVLTFFMPARAQKPDERAAFVRQVIDRVRSIPGVRSVSAAGPLPLDGGVVNVPWATKEEGSADPTAFRQANFHFVVPGYFETMKTRLIAGRTFTEDDNKPANAFKIVIDDALAARAYPLQSAVGKTLLVRNLRGGPNAPFNDEMEIIGVVAHQRHESLAAPGREAIFFVDGYNGYGNAPRWAVRTSGDPESLVKSLRAALAEIDPRAPVSEVQPMQAFVDKANGPLRFAALLIGIFAVAAVVLAAVGLFGVLSTVVRLRTAEIGMRMVFGARQASILRLVIGEGLRLSVAGIVVGLIAAPSITSAMKSMLVAVTSTDPLTFTTITALFLIVAVLASLVPAGRAARLDPTVALREE
jgi:putative ABC transport system permease protein